MRFLGAYGLLGALKGRQVGQNFGAPFRGRPGGAVVAGAMVTPLGGTESDGLVQSFGGMGGLNVQECYRRLPCSPKVNTHQLFHMNKAGVQVS